MRTIELALRDFPSLPATLLGAAGKPVTSVALSMKDLFPQYWLAKYGDEPVGGIFEYEERLTAGPDWRMKGVGIGADTESKRNVSNELGKAFARWCLYKYLGHTYFCPFEVAMARSLSGTGHRWSRREPGDLPDYVCGTGAVDINLLEAKGRYSSVTFDTKEFGDFRKQLARARLCDSAGTELAVKGFISAARWGTEEKPRVKSKLWVEDPWTDGRRGDGNPRQSGTQWCLVTTSPSPGDCSCRSSQTAFNLRFLCSSDRTVSDVAYGCVVQGRWKVASLWAGAFSAAVGTGSFTTTN